MFSSLTIGYFHNSWLYRIRPSVVHAPFQPMQENNALLVSKFNECEVTPTQLRWSPFDLPKEGDSVNFVQGIKTVAGAGDPACRSGLAIHIYTANKDMDRKAFYNSDGDFLIGMYAHMREKKHIFYE